MWLPLVVGMVVGAMLVELGRWMGARSSTSTLEAADAVLGAAKAVSDSSLRTMEEAKEQARLAGWIERLETQAQQQTASGSETLAKVTALEGAVTDLAEMLLARGVVRTMPRQAGEGARNRRERETQPPPPLPVSAMPAARVDPGTTPSSERPTVTG